jgi:hypothetical protein
MSKNNIKKMKKSNVDDEWILYISSVNSGSDYENDVSCTMKNENKRYKNMYQNTQTKKKKISDKRADKLFKIVDIVDDEIVDDEIVDDESCNLTNKDENPDIESSSDDDFLDNDAKECPESSEIYISTKTKILFLNQSVDLKDIFWKLPIISYSEPKTGIIKKQMKFNSLTEDDFLEVKSKLEKEEFVDEYVITSINNPNSRIKFKDIRKITVGISKKDIISYRCKKRSAFYNCFVMIIRINIEEKFREYHVKIFNTGKLEIPGVQSEDHFNIVLDKIIEILQPYYTEELMYKDIIETVLINSNFNTGFYIKREKLYNILRYKYNIQCMYDPCSYPGIQCKFYYNHDLLLQNGNQIINKDKYKNVSEVSFMIFGTGSVLIVGKCDDKILIEIYEFLKSILKNEYRQIVEVGAEVSCLNKDKNKKFRRRQILLINNTPPYPPLHQFTQFCVI